MRRSYRSRRDAVLSALKSCPHAGSFQILEQDAGLHFLLRVDTDLPEEALVARCAAIGIRVKPFSSYYHGSIPPESSKCLVINYSGLQWHQIQLLQQLLQQL